MLFFNILETDPPGVAGGVNGFRAALGQQSTHFVGLVRIGEHDQDGASFAQSIFVKKYLVFRQAFGGSVFDSFAGGDTGGPPNQSQNCSSSHTQGDHGTDPRDQGTGRNRTQGQTTGGAHRDTDNAAHGLSHAGLFSVAGGNGCGLASFLLGSTGQEQGDAGFIYTVKPQGGNRFFGITRGSKDPRFTLHAQLS